MIRKLIGLVFIISALCTDVQAKIADEEGLRVGDVAPVLKARFVKGTSISEYKKGMVYVLEFWATWCIPCKKMMPHVSEIARKHAGKATVIGVSVKERPQGGKSVEQMVDDFVKENAAIMDYNVCMDENDGYMARNFLDSAALTGIPATIIINQQGKVAWIGHPQSMDLPLQQIIDGTFNMAAHKAETDVFQQREFDLKKYGKELEAAVKPVVDGSAAKDYPLVVSSYQKLMARFSNLIVEGYRDYLSGLYYTALVNVDPEKAYQEALKLITTESKYPMALAFSSKDGLDKKFYEYALEYFNKKKVDNYDFALLAAVYFNMGNVAKAVEAQQKWVDAIKSPNARPQMARYLPAAEELLKKYTAALK